jgi:hypothetical protein
LKKEALSLKDALQKVEKKFTFMSVDRGQFQGEGEDDADRVSFSVPSSPSSPSSPTASGTIQDALTALGAFILLTQFVTSNRIPVCVECNASRETMEKQAVSLETFAKEIDKLKFANETLKEMLAQSEEQKLMLKNELKAAEKSVQELRDDVLLLTTKVK